MEKRFSIKTVSEQTGLSSSAIRYYETEGLIKAIYRTHAGVRQFTERDVEWIRFLARLREMEMPITQMKEYAALREQGDSTVDQRIELLSRHKSAMLAKIEHLRSNIGVLDTKIAIYQHMKGKTTDGNHKV